MQVAPVSIAGKPVTGKVTGRKLPTGSVERDATALAYWKSALLNWKGALLNWRISKWNSPAPTLIAMAMI
jgi:hypothetical protein